MDSLSNLRDYFVSKKLEIKEFNGWLIKVKNDTWVMVHGILYKNGIPQIINKKGFLENYTKVHTNDNQSTQTRKWRGISCRRRRGK